MVSLSNAQSRIETKVFQGLGSTVSVYALSSSSISKWGDATLTYATAVTEKGVPYNLISPKPYEKFGTIRANEMDMIFNHTSVVSLNAKVVYRGTEYLVTQLEEFALKDGILAQVGRLSTNL